MTRYPSGFFLPVIKMRSNNSQIYGNKDNYVELLASAFFIYYIPIITLVLSELIDTYLLDWLPLP